MLSRFNTFLDALQCFKYLFRKLGITKNMKKCFHGLRHPTLFLLLFLENANCRKY